MRRAHELRDDVTAYDATSIALAVGLDRPLGAADARLSAAPSTRCDVQLLSSP